MTTLIKTASTIKIQGYSFRPRSRKNLIQEANKASLHSTIPQAQDIVSKRHLVLEGNPLFYAFGYVLKPTNHYTNEYRDE